MSEEITNHNHRDPQPYGDLTQLNTSRIILDAVGQEGLQRIANDFLGLLGTSCAIYEKNGDYALGIFASGWCKQLDEASFRLCKTTDTAAALTSGKWLCHESCWQSASLQAIDNNKPIDVKCHGGIRLYAVPISANDTIIGAINFGYGNPPENKQELLKIGEKFNVPPQQLAAAMTLHPQHSAKIVDEARHRLENAALLIGLIVERHMAQKEAQKTAEQYRMLFETMSQGVLYFDNTGKIVDANPAACEILGRTQDDFVNETQNSSALVIDEEGKEIPFDQLPAVRALREKKRISGDVVGVPNPVDGNIHWILGECVPIIDEESNTLRQLYTIFSDISEKKQTEEALRKSEERLRLSLRAANQGFYDLDMRTGEAVVSPEYATMLGHDPEKFHETNTKWLNRLHPDDRPEVEKKFRAYVAGEIPEYSVEFRQKTRQGKWKWIWSLGKIVEYDDQGNPVRLMGTHTDIDEKKLAEQEKHAAEENMHHAQKLESIGVLAGGIAHDFNNMLMSMMGNADLALNSMDTLHPGRDFVQDIKIASQRAAELCNQMLAYAGKGRFVLETVDLSALVREMGHILKVSISKTTTLRYDIQDDLLPIHADASQMRQVVMNLITNASEAVSETAGFVSVKTSQMRCDHSYLKNLFLGDQLDEGEYVYLEVTDNGMGMDSQTQERIFDPFFTTKFIGRGLGLAATVGIVRGHNGGIKLYSEPGKGTTFKVLFPAIQKDPASNLANPATSDKWQGSGKILLVDDEPMVREVATTMLQSIGFTVETAIDGVEAVKIFSKKHQEYCCVLLDLTMPNMGGEETFRHLRNVDKDVSVILSSGYNEHEIAQRFAGKGHAGFIQKPYTLKNLQEVMQKLPKKL